MELAGCALDEIVDMIRGSEAKRWSLSYSKRDGCVKSSISYWVPCVVRAALALGILKLSVFFGNAKHGEARLSNQYRS